MEKWLPEFTDNSHKENQFLKDQRMIALSGVFDSIEALIIVASYAISLLRPFRAWYWAELEFWILLSPPIFFEPQVYAQEPPFAFVHTERAGHLIPRS